MKPDRWLATVLFTDIVGSTERAAEVGDHRWRELLQAHHALARRELQRFGGRELNTTGDGFLATFEVPERAVRCACAIRDAVRRLGIEIRAGLHTGEVELIERTVGGLAVHIGARVAAQAAPGEVLVSGTVRDMVVGSGFGFEERGAHELKGVPGEWRLYAVVSAPVRLPVRSFWSQAREARLPRMLLIYLGASAAVLWLTAYLRSELQLPPWVLPLAIVLLLIGLIVLSATAWVQSHPLTAARAEREEVPGSWEIGLRDMGKSVARGRLPHLTWGRSILGGVVAFSLLFGLAGLYVLVQDRGQSFSPPEAVAEGAAPGIAVLPFDIRGPGLDVWREGMVDVLSTNLDGVAGLRTIDSRTVLARWRERVRGTESPDLATALEVARRTGARYALVGNAVATGPDVRFAADLYEVEGGRNIGQGQVAGPPDSVLALVDRLSIEVLRALMRGEEGKLPQVRLTSVTTASLPALKAYLEGEGHFRRSDFEEAIRAYRRAIEADSTFALALYRLGLSYGWIEGIRSDLPTRYVERAARLADRLPPREALIVKGDLALQRASLEGLTILQQAVREYPEDAEAWYLLGDTYVHLGPQGLTAQEEVEKALSRALELDPTFAPAYIHYLEYAFSRHADSALAAERVAAYGKLASGGEKDVENRLAFALAFGDSSARSQARSALDTLQLFSLGDMSVSYLTHPRLWRAQSAVLAAASRRELEDDDRLFFLIRFLFSTFNRGKLQEMLETLDDPGTPAGARAGWLYFFFMQGMSVPPDRLEEELRPAEADSFPDVRTFYVGAYAADRERWADHAAAVARLREDAKSLHAAGDSASAAKAEGTALALEGYASWRRGRADEALRLLQAAQQRATGYGPEGAINATIRWWLGRLLQESGRPREAERYFSSFWQSPLAAYHLGKVYEELEDYEKARSSYEFFAEAWRDADPELQPMVEEARAAISRLTSVIRE